MRRKESGLQTNIGMEFQDEKLVSTKAPRKVKETLCFSNGMESS